MSPSGRWLNTRENQVTILGSLTNYPQTHIQLLMFTRTLPSGGLHSASAANHFSDQSASSMKTLQCTIMPLICKCNLPQPGWVSGLLCHSVFVVYPTQHRRTTSQIRVRLQWRLLMHHHAHYLFTQPKLGVSALLLKPSSDDSASSCIIYFLICICICICICLSALLCFCGEPLFKPFSECIYNSLN